ncbi:hypothetical protein [Acidicapsa acidisoli]|uniref:hypothetical protein n=1 Tax=Acidicapsa acidisoli TaxID=1615681 RepID=UPI0021DFD96C|nr:hypothetical protein [Acidicapsa acidisoli]
MNVIAEELNFPTSIAFGDDSAMYVAESGLSFGGERTCLVQGLRPPVNGRLFHQPRRT